MGYCESCDYDLCDLCYQQRAAARPAALRSRSAGVAVGHTTPRQGTPEVTAVGSRAQLSAADDAASKSAAAMLTSMAPRGLSGMFSVLDSPLTPPPTLGSLATSNYTAAPRPLSTVS